MLSNKLRSLSNFSQACTLWFYYITVLINPICVIKAFRSNRGCHEKCDLSYLHIHEMSTNEPVLGNLVYKDL